MTTAGEPTVTAGVSRGPLPAPPVSDLECELAKLNAAHADLEAVSAKERRLIDQMQARQRRRGLEMAHLRAKMTRLLLRSHGINPDQ
jgi:hypothetical protein